MYENVCTGRPGGVTLVTLPLASYVTWIDEPSVSVCVVIRPARSYDSVCVRPRGSVTVWRSPLAVVREGHRARIDAGSGGHRRESTPAVVGAIDRFESRDLRLYEPALRIDGFAAMPAHRRRRGLRPGGGIVGARKRVPVDRDRLGLRAQAQRVARIRNRRRPGGQRRQQLSAGCLDALRSSRSARTLPSEDRVPSVSDVVVPSA